MWRLNNCYFCVTKEGERFQFQMKEGMFRLWVLGHWRNILLKARQYGFTTFIDLMILDTCLFRPNIRAGIIAHHLDDAKTIFRDKIQYPFDNFLLLPADEDDPEGRRDSGMAVRASLGRRSRRQDEMVLRNNSSIRVATSMRSGTVQLLHVSELGKISAVFPEKAREIRSGAFEAASSMKAQIWVESTAEGRMGVFYDLCRKAMDARAMEKKLGPLDFKFHFHPWHKDPDNVLDPEFAIITTELAQYFMDLEEGYGIVLTAEQQAWYVAKLDTLQDDMMREHPSTPEEAFQASIEGACYKRQMAVARREKRICTVPWQPDLPVNTFWDTGHRDATGIVFQQRVGPMNHIIEAVEHSGEDWPFYARLLSRKPYAYGVHYFPWDAEQHVPEVGKTRIEVFTDLGIRPNEVAPKIGEQQDGIDAVRALLNTCIIDVEKADLLIKSLDNYHYEWDEKHGVWGSKPVHDWSSHLCKAMETLAVGYYAIREVRRNRRRERNWKIL